jgi:hypothetical protein
VTGHGDYGNDHGYDRGVWKLRTLPLPDQERPGPARKRTCAVYGAESGCSMENGSICGGHVYRPHASNDAHGGVDTSIPSPRNSLPSCRSANGICALLPPARYPLETVLDSGGTHNRIRSHNRLGDNDGEGHPGTRCFRRDDGQDPLGPDYEDQDSSRGSPRRWGVLAGRIDRGRGGSDDRRSRPLSAVVAPAGME